MRIYDTRYQSRWRPVDINTFLFHTRGAFGRPDKVQTDYGGVTARVYCQPGCRPCGIALLSPGPDTKYFVNRG
jgi:hypothetical protein